MKTFSFALMLLAGLSFVLMACSDNSAPMVSPTEQTVSRLSEVNAASLGKSGSVLNSVSGSVHNFVRINAGTSGKKWDFFANISLSARLGQDNTTSGSIRVQYIGTPPPGYFPEFSGRIFQLMVEDNPGVGRMAKVMFEITEGADLFPPEYGPIPVGLLVVVDGGEGKKGLPDCTVVWAAIDSPEVIQSIGLYAISPLGYAQLIESMLPPDVSLYLPIDNGNIQVR